MSGSCEFGISPAVGKFYSQFNNVMAVLSKQNNEMTAAHLMKKLLPIISPVSVAPSNSFRRIFNCCW